MNARSVEVDYYFGSVNISLPLLILLGVIAGAFLTYLALLPKLWQLYRFKRRLMDRSNGH